ncbi:penicillin V acylase-like [Montipora foliosa]|uniref:penicillin V acylase-like n=1 Tax=Montipora foliosa TaxID=591990 RepID=UPI0035F1B678
MKLLMAIQLLFHAFLGTDACAEFRLTATEDKSVIIARSMEFAEDLLSHIIVEPTKYPHIATPAENCTSDKSNSYLNWTNSYSITYLDAWNTSLATDGMNSDGLSVASLYLPNFTTYQEVPVDKCEQAVSQLELPLWLLGNFKTVNEVRESLSRGSFPLVFEQKLQNFSIPVHFSVQDKTGDGIVIEYTEKGRQVYDNTLGVLTNSPPYDFQMLNIRNYIELSNYNREPLKLGEDTFPAPGQGSGLLGMPGDLTPPSRFVRVAAFKNFANQPNTSTEAVNVAFHVLNSVDIAKGLVKNQTTNKSDFTMWAVAKDLTNYILYFRDYNDMTIRVVYLNSLPPVPQGKVLRMKVYTDNSGFQDVTDQFQSVHPTEFSPRQDEL